MKYEIQTFIRVITKNVLYNLGYINHDALWLTKKKYILLGLRTLLCINIGTFFFII